MMGAIDSTLGPPNDDDFVAGLLAVRGVPERVNYATGVLLGADDFGDEQLYLRSRTARALSALYGQGTLAGLRVRCPLTLTDASGTATSNADLEVQVFPGLALDRLGRLIEVRSTQCISIAKWLANLAAQPVSDLDRVSVIAAVRAAEAPDTGLVLVLDVFVRYVVCAHGRTPAFAAGPFNATDYVVPSRLADAYEMSLLLANTIRANPGNPSDTTTVLAVPGQRSDPLQAMADAVAAITDPAQLATAQKAFALASVFDAWPLPDPIDPTRLQKLREQPSEADWDRLFLARVIVPVTQASPGAFPALDAVRLADPSGTRDLADNTLRPIVFNPLAWHGAI
jgi:hypothetical protein